MTTPHNTPDEETRPVSEGVGTKDRLSPVHMTLRRITFTAMIAALYFAITWIEGGIASGFFVNVRFSEGLAVFALFAPETIAGVSLGCFLYNLIFGMGILDASMGTLATFLGASYIYLIGRFVKNKHAKMALSGLMLVLMNAILVPMVLILSNVEGCTWDLYWTSFGLVALGEATAYYTVGYVLYYTCLPWLPKMLKQ